MHSIKKIYIISSLARQKQTRKDVNLIAMNARKFQISFSFASTSYLYRRQFSQELLKRIYMHLWSHMAKLSRFHSENFWNNETPFYVDKRMHFIWLSLDWQKKNQMCLLKIKSMNCRANGYNYHCETIFNRLKWIGVCTSTLWH